jgi:hypothetical protein
MDGGGVPARREMRKRLKNKKRSCAMCKPQKRGWDNRWKPKEEDRLRRWERERREWKDHRPNHPDHPD